MTELSFEEIKSVLPHLNEKQKEDLLIKHYKPGNQEIGDLLIAKGSSSTLEKEIMYAQQKNDRERFLSLAKRHIKYHIENSRHISIKDRLKSVSNQELNEYVFELMGNYKQSKETLKNAIYLIEVIGTKQQIQEAHETLLEFQLQNNEYPTAACHILEDLGRYDEAIDRYLKYNNDGGYLYLAKNIAEKHVPLRIKEVNETIVKRGIKSGIATFVDACKYLGKDEYAKEVIEKIIVDYYNNNFKGKNQDLAQGLFLLGLDTELQTLINNIESNIPPIDDHHLSIRDSHNSFAQLLTSVGQKDKALQYYKNVISYELEHCHPSHSQSTIKKIKEIYEEDILLDIELQISSNNNDFSRAREIAKLLGQDEKAHAYELMQKFKGKQ